MKKLMLVIAAWSLVPTQSLATTTTVQTPTSEVIVALDTDGLGDWLKNQKSDRGKMPKS